LCGRLVGHIAKIELFWDIANCMVVRGG
jgi:hypothetical protein